MKTHEAVTLSQLHYLFFLQKDHEKSRTIRDREEKLMVTAWYNLVSMIHWRVSVKKLEIQTVVLCRGAAASIFWER